MTDSLHRFRRTHPPVLQRLLRQSRQPAAPVWAARIAAWRTLARTDPAAALRRGAVAPLLRILGAMALCETRMAQLSGDVPRVSALTCGAHDTVLAAIGDLLDCVAARDPGLASDLALQVMSETRANLDRAAVLIQARHAADRDTAEVID